MLDHVTLTVSDFKKSRAFYDAALAAIGVLPLWEDPAEPGGPVTAIGYGRPPRPTFWIAQGPKASGPSHVAFNTFTRAEVDAFHAEALKAGGRDNGAPGLRPQYDPNYYAAFILDPDGNNVEAVCHSRSDC
jgi:catechol 2,3-dioxygenase-like lactoylglutathione lyase family enzyme